MTNTITKVTDQCSSLQCFEDVGAGQSVANAPGEDAYTACQCGGLFKPVAMALLLGKLWGSRPPSSADIFNDAAESYGAKLHDDWRASREVLVGALEAIDGQPMRLPRWKAVASDDPVLANISGFFKRVVEKDGKPVIEVDIANLDFAHLPEKWAFENREAAKAAMGIVKEAAGKLTGAEENSIADPVTVKIDLEAAAATVHEQWLARNGSWAPPEQNKPYAQLSEEEKAKDRVIVIGVLEHLYERVAAEDILSLPPLARGLGLLYEQQGDILMKAKKYSEASEIYIKATKSWARYPTANRGIIATFEELRSQPKVVGADKYMHLLDKFIDAKRMEAVDTAGGHEILNKARDIFIPAIELLQDRENDAIRNSLLIRSREIAIEARVLQWLETNAEGWTKMPKAKAVVRLQTTYRSVTMALDTGNILLRDIYVVEGAELKGIAKVVVAMDLREISDLLAQPESAKNFRAIARAYRELSKIHLSLGNIEMAIQTKGAEMGNWLVSGNETAANRARHESMRLGDALRKKSMGALKAGLASGQTLVLIDSNGRPPRAIGVGGEGQLGAIGTERKGEEGKGPGKDGRKGRERPGR